MSKLSIATKVLGLVAGAGTGAVIRNAVNATTPADIGRLNKRLVQVGYFTISGIVGAAAAKYVESEVQDYVDIFQGVKKTVQDPKVKDAAENLTQHAKEVKTETTEIFSGKASDDEN